MLKTPPTPIKPIDLVGQNSHIKEELDTVIKDVVDSGYYIGGPYLKKFVEDLEKYLGVKHVIPCGNGTDAITIALMALGLKEGDEVIVPSFTFVGTAGAAAILGIKPVFVDVDLDNFMMLPGEIEKNISSRTRAIIPVHLYGQNADMETIMDISNQHGLKVIEDAAQSLGSSFCTQNSHGRSGTIGDLGTTSFYPTKNLSCFGNGGAIFTNSDEIAERCKIFPEHGERERYRSAEIGMNSRLDAIQAAVLSVKLKYLDDYNTKRKRVASRYDELLSGLGQVQTPARVGWSDHIYHQYTLKVEGSNRDNLKKYLNENGVPANVYYPNPIHVQPGYAQYSNGNLPNSEMLSKSVLSLPIHTELRNDQIEYVSEAIHEFFR